MTPAVFLMGIGPVARWKSARLPDIAVRLCWAALVSVASAVALPWLAGEWKPMVALGMLLAVWCATTVLTALASRIADQRGPFLLRFFHVPRSFYGMLAAHLGIGVFIAGVTLVKGYETASDGRLDTGQSITSGAYTFRFDGTKAVDGPNYRALRAKVVVSHEGQVVAVMHPEKRFFAVQKSTMTEAAVDRGLFRDLYVALGDAADNSATAWTVRVQIKPFVDWIWAGCLMMAFGGILAASDRRYRLAVRARRAASRVASVSRHGGVQTQAAIAVVHAKETHP
jgi:cytochrome c-type biogenesis protein CcmF